MKRGQGRCGSYVAVPGRGGGPRDVYVLLRARKRRVMLWPPVLAVLVWWRGGWSDSLVRTTAIGVLHPPCMSFYFKNESGRTRYYSSK